MIAAMTSQVPSLHRRHKRMLRRRKQPPRRNLPSKPHQLNSQLPKVNKHQPKRLSKSHLVKRNPHLEKTKAWNSRSAHPHKPRAVSHPKRPSLKPHQSPVRMKAPHQRKSQTHPSALLKRNLKRSQLPKPRLKKSLHPRQVRKSHPKDLVTRKALPKRRRIALPARITNEVTSFHTRQPTVRTVR